METKPAHGPAPQASLYLPWPGIAEAVRPFPPHDLRPRTGVFVCLLLLAWPLKVYRDSGGPPDLLQLLSALSVLYGLPLAASATGWLDGWRLALAALALWYLPAVYAGVGGDGREHFVIARSLLFDRDLDFSNDFQGLGAEAIESRGLAVSRVALGVSLLWMPPLMLTHAVVLGARSLGFAAEADGFSAPYQSAATSASYVYLVAGLFLIEQLLRRFYGPAVAFTCIAALWLASPSHFYSTANPAMSHAPAVASAALFLSACFRARGTDSVLKWAAFGAAGALLSLVRPQHAVLLCLAPLMAWEQGGRSAQASTGWVGRRFFLRLGAFSIVPALASVVQALEWRAVYGPEFVSIVRSQELVAQVRPHVQDFLFSARKGFFSWTPLYLAVPFGWLLWLARDRLLAVGFGLVFALSVLVNSSMGDWWGSDAFGQRRLLALTPFFAFGLAQAIEFAVRRPLIPIGGWLLALILWNLQFAYIYNSEIVAGKSQAITLDRLSAAQLEVTYRRLVSAQRWMPGRLWVLLYDNLRGVWLDEGSNSLGGRIDLGREPTDFPQAIGNGWDGPEREGDVAFRRSRALRSWLVVPVRTVGDFTAVVRLRPELPGVRVALEVNGTATNEVTPVEGWGEYALPIPARMLRSGFNAVALSYSSTPRRTFPAWRGRNSVAAVDWIALRREKPLLRSYKE